jgi:hypothetical protein
MAMANPPLFPQLHGTHKSHLHSGLGSDRSSKYEAYNKLLEAKHESLISFNKADEL